MAKPVVPSTWRLERGSIAAIRSTSPDSSALTRAPLSEMPKYSTSSSQGPTPFQKFPLRAAMERTPGWNSLHVKGPVPMAVVKSVVPSFTILKW